MFRFGHFPSVLSLLCCVIKRPWIETSKIIQNKYNILFHSFHWFGLSLFPIVCHNNNVHVERKVRQTQIYWFLNDHKLNCTSDFPFRVKAEHVTWQRWYRYFRRELKLSIQQRYHESKKVNSPFSNQSYN